MYFLLQLCTGCNLHWKKNAITMKNLIRNLLWKYSPENAILTTKEINGLDILLP